MIVRLLRWITGYAVLKVCGRSPERFVNIAVRRGFIIWSMKNDGDSFSVSARKRDIRELTSLAGKAGCTLEIVREYGLPVLLQKYRSRCGLLVGLILSAAMCFFLSGFVWHISVTVPDSINEYEMRQMLRECGVYEGMRSGSIHTDAIVDHICSKDSRISWMTINIMGTDAEVVVSPRLAKPESADEKIMFSNMKSTADGTVTRVNVYNGTANVKPGDGIRKNQLLVSGLVEYTNGKTVLTDAKALVFAKTHRSVCITIPKTGTVMQKTDLTVKRDLTFFGLKLPLSLSAEADGIFTKQGKRQTLTVLGHEIPVSVSEEEWQYYEKRPVRRSPEQAEIILKNKLALYEFFMLSSADRARIMDRSVTFSEDENSFILNAEYDIEENVCSKTVVQTDLNP